MSTSLAVQFKNFAAATQTRAQAVANGGKAVVLGGIESVKGIAKGASKELQSSNTRQEIALASVALAVAGAVIGVILMLGVMATPAGIIGLGVAGGLALAGAVILGKVIYSKVSAYMEQRAIFNRMKAATLSPEKLNAIYKEQAKRKADAAHEAMGNEGARNNKFRAAVALAGVAAVGAVAYMAGAFTAAAPVIAQLPSQVGRFAAEAAAQVPKFCLPVCPFNATVVAAPVVNPTAVTTPVVNAMASAVNATAVARTSGFGFGFRLFGF